MSKTAKKTPASAREILIAERALAAIGIQTSLRASGADRLDFVELHVDQLVELVNSVIARQNRIWRERGEG